MRPLPRVAVVVGLVVVVAGSACSGHRPPTTGVSGTVVISGGRWPGHPRREADLPVVALDAAGRTAGRTVLRPDQDRFRLVLPRGSYRLQTRYGNLTCAAAPVTVPSARDVTLVCQLK